MISDIGSCLSKVMRKFHTNYSYCYKRIFCKTCKWTEDLTTFKLWTPLVIIQIYQCWFILRYTSAACWNDKRIIKVIDLHHLTFRVLIFISPFYQGNNVLTVWLELDYNNYGVVLEHFSHYIGQISYSFQKIDNFSACQKMGHVTVYFQAD